jgi:CofD-related protein of GAK system
MNDEKLEPLKLLVNDLISHKIWTSKKGRQAKMNDEKLEPLKLLVNDRKQQTIDKETRMRKLRGSSFSDSLDDVSSSSDDHHDPSIRSCALHRARNRRLNFSSNTTRNPDVFVTVIRDIRLPDDDRVKRSLRLPEFGPKILFFSGGTATKDLSETLTKYTHNSIHLITPFDSGGSSAELRRAFDMLSIGDIRNRLIALSDKNYETTMRNNPQIIELFNHRIVKTEEGGSEASENEFLNILGGKHPLIRAVELPMRSILQNSLRWFFDRMPNDFDLRGASIGNLIITGMFLEHNRDIVTAIFITSKFLGVKGFCRPLTAANLHIRCLYNDGREEVGQHLMNGLKSNSNTTDSNKIVRIDLVKDLYPSTSSSEEERQESQSCHIDRLSAELVSSTADLICFPMGSFFASILVNVLPRGVGRAIVERKCPKIYIPNTGYDPEMSGRTLAECVSLLIDMIRADPCHTRRLSKQQEEQEEDEDEGDNCQEKEIDLRDVVPVKDILNFVLLDTINCEYCVPVDKTAIEKLGVVVIDMPLVDYSNNDDNNGNEQYQNNNNHGSKSMILDPTKVAEVLLSLSS